MSKPWGGIGSWAAEAEREEAEERENATTTATAAAATNTQSFPSLKEAITAKPKKKKMTLSEFNSYGSKGGPVSSGSTRLTPDEMLQLPTAPKPRSGGESSGPRLGGGFSSYGDDRRTQRRGLDDDRRQKRGDFDSMPPPPSRADEVDNWASMKKPISMMDSGRGVSSGGGGGGGGSRYGSLGGGSRADEVYNWSFGKKPQPVSGMGGGGGGGGGRSSTFGFGFRDSGSDWRRGGGELGGERELGRTRLVLDPPTGRNGENVVKTATETTTASKANPFGAARPREEVLAEKGLDWKKLDSEIEAKKVVAGGSTSGSRPTSSQGSRPTSSQSNRGSDSVGGGLEIKPRPKVNPFGEAKPRELLLEQKGLDWRKIDLELEHRRVDRPETEEEKALKEEIENLRKELEEESGNDAPQESEGEQTSLSDLIKSKERDLDALTRELDDKVRFGQKAVERPGSRHGSRPSSGAGRPGSGAGRFTSFSERPPPQSGSFDNGRVPEVMDRPQSRGTGDVWTRPGEDRRGGFQGGRDRGGFLGNRDFDRSTSRERW